MRLWSLHPRYLDAKGLTALWREGLLARKVLKNETRGYRNHPQLARFRVQEDPVAAIDFYLRAVYEESLRRGYRYDQSKIEIGPPVSLISTTDGQLQYELAHLKEKLRLRAPDLYDKILPLQDPEPHPLFRVISGNIADWEKGVRRKNKNLLSAQQGHWETTFAETEDLFGDEPSESACRAAELFKKEGVTRILELGAGQGRDTLFFARQGFRVEALDYTETGINAIEDTARRLGVAASITARRHDLRQPLPFADATFDACYSHMMFCMAFTTAELAFIAGEVRRVLKPAGLHVYTVRHTGDAHYGRGIHHGEDLYELNGFIVHFFNREKVKALARGFEIAGIDEFEEGPLPRKLFHVTLRKQGTLDKLSGEGI